MIKNYDESIDINDNSNCLYIPDHPDRVLIISRSGLRKTNVLLYLIKHQQPHINKSYLCQRSIWIKLSITYSWKEKSRD